VASHTPLVDIEADGYPGTQIPGVLAAQTEIARVSQLGAAYVLRAKKPFGTTGSIAAVATQE